MMSGGWSGLRAPNQAPGSGLSARGGASRQLAIRRWGGAAIRRHEVLRAVPSVLCLGDKGVRNRPSSADVPRVYGPPQWNNNNNNNNK